MKDEDERSSHSSDEVNQEEEETANQTCCTSSSNILKDEEDEDEDQQQTKIPAVTEHSSSQLEIPEETKRSPDGNIERNNYFCRKTSIGESDQKKPLPRIIRQRADELRSDFPYVEEETKTEEEADIPGFSLIDKEVTVVDSSPPLRTKMSATAAANNNSNNSSSSSSRTSNHHQESASLSTLTTATASNNSLSREEQQLKREYAHSPPAIPRPTAFASAPSVASISEGTTRRGSSPACYNKSEYGTAANGRPYKSIGPGLPLPDYKAQVNNRSFLQINESDLLVDGVPENGSTSRSAIADADAAQGGTTTAVSVVAEHVVTTTPSARQISNGSGESQQRQQDDADIPVVPAILVPQERLDAEHRHRSDGQQSGTTTLSNTDSSVGSHANNNNSNDRTESNGQSQGSRSKSRSDAAPNENAPPSDRQLWVTLIIAAMALNSILVTGVVVASFCAAGKCKPSSSSSINEDVVPTPSFPPPPTLAPSVQPAGNRWLSAMPTDSIFAVPEDEDDSPSAANMDGGSLYPPPSAPVAAGTATPPPTAILPDPSEGDTGGNNKENNGVNGASAEPDQASSSSSSGLPLMVI